MIPTSSPAKAHKTLHLALFDVGSQIAPENWSHYRSTRPLVHADMPSAPARLAAALTADFALANSAAPVVSGSAPAPHRAHHSREAQSAGDPTGARRASGADESTGPALAPPPPAVGEDAPARAQGRAMDAQGRAMDAGQLRAHGQAPKLLPEERTTTPLATAPPRGRFTASRWPEHRSPSAPQHTADAAPAASWGLDGPAQI